MMFMITFQAIDRRDGKLKTWRDRNIEAMGFFDAEFQLQRQGKFHCKVEGVLLTDFDGDNIEEQKLLN